MYSLSKYSLSKYFILALLCLLIGSSALAQSTTVSGQVTDLGGQSWNNGTFTFQFIPNNNFPSSTYSWTGGVLNQTITGSLNATGGYSQSVPSSTSITPSLSQWRLQVCSGTTPVNCFSVTQTITGGSQTVNVTPTAITVPPGAGNTAYVTGEVSPATVGSQIYIIGSGLQLCSTVVGGVCTAWTGSGSSSLGNQSSQVQDAYAYGVRTAQVRYTGSTSNGSAVVTCTNCFTLAQPGWLIQVTSGPSFAATRAQSILVIPQTTILTVTDVSHVTVASGTANSTVSNATVGFGPDNTAAMTAWWTAIAGSATTNCGSGMLIPGFIFVTSNFGSNSNSCIPTGGEGTTDLGVVIRGWGPKTSYIVPMSSFNFATNCTGTRLGCFFDFNGMRMDSFGIYGLDYNNTNLASEADILVCEVDCQMSFVDLNGWGASDASNRLFGLKNWGSQSIFGINIDGAGSTGLNAPPANIGNAIYEAFIGDQNNQLALVQGGLGCNNCAWGPVAGSGQTEMSVTGTYVGVGGFWNSTSGNSIAIQVSGTGSIILRGENINDSVNGGSTVINMVGASSSVFSWGSTIAGPVGGNGIIIAAGASYCGIGDTVTGTNAITGTPKCTMGPKNGFAAFTHLTQPITASYAGSCSMSAATTCTITMTVAYTSAPLCFPTPTTSPATAVAGSCALSGTTLTITAGASNSLTWNALLIGNPN